MPVQGGCSASAESPRIVSHCAEATDGKAYCWGNNTRGQLGSAAPAAPTGSPRRPSPAGHFSWSRPDHSTLRRHFGKRLLRGDNQFGQLGDPGSSGYTRTSRSRGGGLTSSGLTRVQPHLAGDHLVAVFAGAATPSDSSARGRPPISSRPAIAGNRLYKQVSAGSVHSCALASTTSLLLG